MKKGILLILLVFASVGDMTAQDNNSATTTDKKNYVDSLTTTLNTLQHDYDYLYCNYMLSDIQLNIKDYSTELSAKSNAILINCYHSRFDIDLYSAYKANYNANLELYDSVKGKAEAVISAVTLKMLTSNFSNDEISILANGCKFVDYCLNSAKSSLDYYKVVLDIYKDLR